MPSTMPLRVGDDLLASAKLAADASGRSAAQQIGYWAKLGRELERSGSVSSREIADVLAGARSYDDLDPKAQASVRAEWDARIEARRVALNVAERFTAEGRSWVEAGPDGATVRHPTAGDNATPGRRPRLAASREDASPSTPSQSTPKKDRERKARAGREVAAAKTTEGAASRKTAAPVNEALVKKATARKKASDRAH